ncbi:MAG TPA: outer membrane beta-barrel protein [Bryobacteraceae bacterium]|nr:outer membrane beta-barrel protein [Bryobacteraceae bacterium]
MKPGPVLLRVALILVAGSAALLAASDGGKADVYGQVGYFHEFETPSDGGFLAGGGASYRFRNCAAVFGEFDYTHLSASASSASYGNTTTATASGFLVQFGGGLRAYLLPPSSRVRPYFPVFGGMWHSGATATLTTSYSSETATGSSDGGLMGVGFGVEVGLTPHWGIRPEFRFLREFAGNSDDSNAMNLTLALYYRFGK